MSLKAMLGGLALCIAIATGGDAAACDCIPGSAPAQALAGADVVFRGEVVEVRDTAALSRWEIRPFFFVVRFKVTTAWKGVSAPEFTLGTGQGGGDCGKRFERGEEYVVYAYRNDRETAEVMERATKSPIAWPDFNTHICTRTSRVRDAGVDLAFLKSQKTLPLRAPAQRVPPQGRKR